MNAGTLCSRRVVIAHPEERLLDAAQRMLEYNVGTLVVVEADVEADPASTSALRSARRKPVGILTDRDIVVGAIARHQDRMGALSVGDTMSSELHVAREQDSLDDVLRQMRAHAIRRIPIVDEQGGLQGLLTLDDLLDWLAEELSDISTVLRHQEPSV
jgi:CBS domain-containing protein